MAAPTVPLTWRNVTAPDGSGALNAFNRAGQNLGGAFEDLGGHIKQGASDYADYETQQFIADLNAAPDDATRNQMVQDASRAFLKMDQVNQAVTDAQNQDFRVNEEARAAKRADEATRLFEQTFAQTERTDPLKVRQLEAGVKSDELKLEVDEEFLKNNADLRHQLLAAKTKIANATTDVEIKTAKANYQKLQNTIQYAANEEKRKQNEEERRKVRSSEQTTRFDQKVTEWSQTQDDRKRRLEREEFINTEIGATSDRIRFPTTLDRYTHLQGIIKNAADQNMTLTPDQRSRISKELAKVSSRLRPQDVLPTALRGQFTQAFTNLARRPKLLPNNQPALNSAGQPIYIEPTASEVATFASDVSKNIARLNPDLGKEDIERITKETMAGLPQFTKIAKTANLKDQIVKGSDKATVNEAVKSSEWNARINEAENRVGLQNIIREFMRKEGGAAFDADTIDDEDINIDIQAMWNKVAEILGPTKPDSDIAKAVIRVVGTSHVDKSWMGYSDTQFRLGGKSYDWSGWDDWIDTDAKAKTNLLRDYLLGKPKKKP